MIFVLILCLCPIQASRGAIPVIPLGNWSLGDTYELRYGQENFKTYTYSEVQNLYNSNNIDAKNNELNLETNYFQYQQYSLQLETISDSIEKYKQLSEQYRALAKTYEDEMNGSTGPQREAAEQNMQNSLLNAQSYELEIANAIGQKAEVYVQKENCLFIQNNATTLRNQQSIAQLSQFRNTVYEINLLNQEFYLQGILSENASLQADTQAINKAKDISFQTDIDFFNADFSYYINQQEMCKQQINNSFEMLLNSANITTSQGAIIITDIRTIRTLEPISYAIMESNGISNDIKKRQLENKLRILDGKLNILKEYYADSSNQVLLVINEKSLTVLELNKWLIQRKNSLQKAYAIYSSKYNEIGINEKKAKAQYEKYIILLNKYNYGLTDKLAVKDAEINYMQSNLTAWNTLYEYANALGNVDKCISGNIQ